MAVSAYLAVHNQQCHMQAALSQQRKELDAVSARQLQLIDRLLADKDDLCAKCAALASEVKVSLCCSTHAKASALRMQRVALGTRQQPLLDGCVLVDGVKLYLVLPGENCSLMLSTCKAAAVLVTRSPETAPCQACLVEGGSSVNIWLGNMTAPLLMHKMYTSCICMQQGSPRLSA